MSRIVCFTDDNGQTATCVSDGYCEYCEHNDDKHKKWVAEINAKPSLMKAEAESKKYPKLENYNEFSLVEDLKKHAFKIDVSFTDQDIIIYAWASTDGIQVTTVTRCFDEDFGCEDADCLHCPYTDKSKEQAILDKYEEPIVEILRDAYKKIEALRVKE